MRAVVTVGFGTRPDVGKPGEQDIIGTPFHEKLVRLKASFEKYSRDTRVIVYPQLPNGCPEHMDRPYAFKAYALCEARNFGYDQLIWADSSVYAVHDIELLWELIDARGYFLVRNGSGSCGEWTADSALEPLGITRREAFDIPQIAATCFGLNMNSPIAASFLSEYFRLASQTNAFSGPWVNDKLQASGNLRVRGHRHDQTAASVIAWRLGMKLSPGPIWEDWPSVSQDTVLQVRR
jgi:hypothetical protein